MVGNNSGHSQVLLRFPCGTAAAGSGELCSVSSGDWVEAFRAEQTQLQGWVAKMISIGTEYIETALRIAEKYEEAENAIKRQIGAR